MESSVQQKIEQWAGESIQRKESLSGGCIANAQKITMGSGQSYFLKYSGSVVASGTASFIQEAHGLRELSEAKAIRIPNVLLQDSRFLLLEYIRPGTVSDRSNFFKQFGEQFAALHRLQGAQFGFYEDNLIGATPQHNQPTASEAQNWIEFYFNKRLLVQYRLAETNGYVTEEMQQKFSLLENQMESILGGTQEPPSLLHGDLWSGNFIVDDQGEPCLIDPAVYYGHREADLAMTTLFGGFDQAFYQAYQNVFPLPLGHETRQPLYQLYHVMNHLNLFGTGYLGQTLSILRQYT